MFLRLCGPPSIPLSFSLATVLPRRDTYCVNSGTRGIETPNDPYLKKVASLTLSPGKFVYVITLNSRAYLVGVSDNSVNLIAEIEDKELVDAMNLNAPQGADEKKPMDFSSILGKFVNTNGRNYASANKKTSGGFSTSSAVELLQNQRSRLQNTTEDDDVTP